MDPSFTAEEIEKCKAAMSKPAPRQALELIGSGRAVIELTPDRRDVRIVELDGRPIIDDEHPHLPPGMFLSGAWPLFRAGMIDEFGCITAAGRDLLATSEG